jgi:VanZ family protein
MMTKSTRGPGFWFDAWSPVVVWIFLIAIESTPYLGADHTSAPLRRIFEFLYGPVGDTRWESLHGLIRKSGHFLGYGLMALAWLRAWRMSFPTLRFWKNVSLATLGTTLVASLDEWHQTFLPNRTGTPRDVLLDCSGAIALQILIYIAMITRSPTA